MQNGGRLVFPYNRDEALPLGDVALSQGAPFNGPSVSSSQIVISDGQVPCRSQGLASMAADITSAACYEDRGHVTFSNCERRRMLLLLDPYVQA